MSAASAPQGGASALDRVLAAMEEAALGLWRRRPLALATVAAIAVTLAFPTLLVLAASWSLRLVDDMAARQRVRVFLLDAASPAEVASLRAILASTPGIAGVEVVSASAARDAFRRRFPELVGAADDLGPDELTFPASIEAWSAGDPQALELAARAALGRPGVEEVRQDAAAARRLAGLRAGLKAGAGVTCALGLMAAAFGIGNVIRIGALARREQLAVMRLVGAPRLHVRLPFVLEGVVQGALGGVLAGVFASAAARLLARPLGAILPAAHEGVPATFFAVLVAAPALAGGLAAALAVESVLRRHARLER